MMYSKAQLLTMLREEFDRWEVLLAGLSEDQITSRQLPADLSIKDVVGHLRMWEQVSIARLQAALDNMEPDYAGWPEGDPDTQDLEKVNAWIHDTNRDQPWATVHAAWRAGFQHFLDLAEAVPEQDLLEVGKYHWLEDYALGEVLLSSLRHHHEEHYEPLTAWLRQNAS
jgi:hypothetical protein